jgi:hypothetical protein
MTSKIKVDNINKVSDDSNIINKCGTTVTVGAASDSVRTGSNNLQASDGGNLISQSGTTITLGASGDTIALASGASQTGFGSPGQVIDWQTSDIKTTTFTAESDKGYFINSGSAITMNLPAGTAGDVVAVADYARNFGTYKFTVSPNGSQKIGGIAGDAELTVNGQAATFVFVDSTKGWVNVQNAEATETGLTGFIMATGGTITTCGNDTIHTFTGPGTFCVSNIADVAANNQVSYMVVAGGGAGGGSHGGGGGGGGFREDSSPTAPYTASPLEGAGAITVTATAFPITVGAGGTGGSNPSSQGGDSVFSTITSAGGGVGGSYGISMQPYTAGGSGGGGGGGPACQAGASGNTPPTNPSQGNNGAAGVAGSRLVGGGGGGAGAAGTAATPSGAGAGGAGIATSINGTPTLRSGGGGGGGAAPSYPGAAGGPGGGGNGSSTLGGFGSDGTANTGGGGGGGNTGNAPGGHGGSGGSGIVIIRYKTS